MSIELQSSVDNWKGDQSQSEPDVSSNSEFESVSSKDIRMKMEQM